MGLVNKVHRTRWLFLALALLAVGALLSASSVSAQSTPFTGFTPEGWVWWRGEPGFILLPASAAAGDQARFFLVAPGNRADDWLPGWMGGGEITWQGELTAGGFGWSARVARGQGRQGLVSVSQDGTWTFAAMSPADRWDGDAAVYNLVLKGGTP